MPLSYFDVTDGRGLHQDDHGVECADLEEARQQCWELLPDLAREKMPGSDLHVIACNVRDAVGRVLYRGEITY